MRLSFPTLYVLLTLSCCQPSLFEGQVTYRQQVISKHESVDETLYNQIFGDTVRWTYKAGNYLEESNGSGSPKVIHRHSEASTYTILPDSIVQRDVSLEKKPLDSLYFSGKYMMIMQQPCRELVKVIKGVYHRFWITNGLRVDPGSFSAYKLAYLNRQYEYAPFHYLRYEYESAAFRIEREAVSIDYKSIDPNTFKLAKHKSFNQ